MPAKLLSPEMQPIDPALVSTPSATIRSSESQASARVAGGGMVVMSAIPFAGGPGMPATPGIAGSPERERRVWKGDLHLEGHSLGMMRSIVAIQQDLPGKAPIRDASGWPRQLELIPTNLKSSMQVLDRMTAPESQWCVRFATVDKNGQEREDLKVTQLVMVMTEQKLAFEIKCNEGVGTSGTLYVWGMPVSSHGPFLLGVFRPAK